ncbi:uncharacterized protein YjiS (DUF1127 family) [Aliiruegeria haliotis]|uniref:Uncharacterized protein YjiS (DUF1127 family) n=1 Tax=Aliiruegeria haliotis TaxID=1280846 RepID=A0A2T0RNB4_9RHOB|nr:DUF1127 domain-containing protein [Aliiruegeria haliotis]PRY22648.1 uncharacterized protein YjiS (DUF1127 family) [Aliiruegeria haliotis]
MAFHDTTRPVPATGLRRAVGTVFSEFLAWRDARNTREALSKLTDRELCDIGLKREDIDQMSDAQLRNS